MSEKNPAIRKTIDAGDVDQARALLREALPEANADTYFLAAQVALGDAQRSDFLQKALALDPFHQEAYQALEALGNGGPAASPPAAVIPPPMPESVVTPAPVSTVIPAAEPAPVPAPASAVAPTAATAAPATPPAEEPARALVVGTVRGMLSASLYKVPATSSLVVADLPSGTPVYLIARDDYATWYQVVYESPLGVKYGWMRAEDVQDIHLNGTAIDNRELPITEFELNSREEVKEAIAAVNKQLRQSQNVLTYRIVAVLLGLLAAFPGLLGIMMLETPNTDGIQAGGVICLGAMAVLGFAAVVIWRRARAAYPLQGEALKTWTQQQKAQVKRWQGIQRDKRSDYEKMRDEQRMGMAMGAALNLGSNLLTTAASRYIPDRKVVTTRSR